MASHYSKSSSPPRTRILRPFHSCILLPLWTFQLSWLGVQWIFLILLMNGLSIQDATFSDVYVSSPSSFIPVRLQGLHITTRVTYESLHSIANLLTDLFFSSTVFIILFETLLYISLRSPFSSISSSRFTPRLYLRLSVFKATIWPIPSLLLILRDFVNCYTSSGPQVFWCLLR
jgi:hypothetical protein